MNPASHGFSGLRSQAHWREKLGSGPGGGPSRRGPGPGPGGREGAPRAAAAKPTTARDGGTTSSHPAGGGKKKLPTHRRRVTGALTTTRRAITPLGSSIVSYRDGSDSCLGVSFSGNRCPPREGEVHQPPLSVVTWTNSCGE